MFLLFILKCLTNLTCFYNLPGSWIFSFKCLIILRVLYMQVNTERAMKDVRRKALLELLPFLFKEFITSSRFVMLFIFAYLV